MGAKDSAKLINDTSFRKACYLIEIGDYTNALSELDNLSRKGYTAANEKKFELYYVWGNELIDEEDFLLAYEKLVLAGDYLDTKQVLADLRNYIYYSAIDLYRSAQYDQARKWFTSVGDYLDSDSYLVLINVHKPIPGSLSLADFEYIGDRLRALIGFEDAADLIVSNIVYAQAFLEGTWRGDSKYFIMKPDGHINYDIPWFNYGDYYTIENGYVLLYKEETPSITKKLFKITVISQDCIQIYSYKNNRTYTLFRQ